MQNTQSVNTGLNFDDTILISYDLISEKILILSKINELFALHNYTVQIELLLQRAFFPPVESTSRNQHPYRLEVMYINGNSSLPSFNVTEEDVDVFESISNYLNSQYGLETSDFAISNLYSISVDRENRIIDILMGVNINNTLSNFRTEVSGQCWTDSIGLLSSELEFISESESISDSLKMLSDNMENETEQFWSALR